jgi:hypothetical protein
MDWHRNASRITRKPRPWNTVNMVAGTLWQSCIAVGELDAKFRYRADHTQDELVEHSVAQFSHELYERPVNRSSHEPFNQSNHE